MLFLRSFKSIKGEIDFFSININRNIDIVDAIERIIIIYRFLSNESKNVRASRKVVIVTVKDKTPLKSNELRDSVLDTLRSLHLVYLIRLY
jgi:hypothetical protein